MTSRPTTLVESDQLAQAAVDILKNEDFVPKGKRWPFSKFSKAHKDYEKAVQDIAARRRSSRENAVERQLKKDRAEVDAEFERARSSAETEHSEKISEAKRPFEETEAKARTERDAAIAAANLTYQETIDTAKTTYQEEAAVLDKKRDALVTDAKATHAGAYAVLDSRRKSELARIAYELKTIPLEGPMRVVEDREAWPLEDRRKALIGLVDMAGRDDFDTDYADLCLRNVAGYVFQDRFLKPEAQRHRLMDVNLLESLVDLARRTPEKRPTIVKYMHEIVAQNPGHTSPAFIKTLTELYVIASDDTVSHYAEDVVANETIVETMREQIADALKLTPRRSQVPPPTVDSANPREAVASSSADAQDADNSENTPVVETQPDEEITAEVDVRDLVALEAAEALAAEAEAIIESPSPPSPPSASRPPPVPPPRKGKKATSSPGSN